MLKTVGIGALKGGVLGAAIGAVFALLDTGHHMFDTKLWLFAVVGVAVGLLCGKPIWRGGYVSTSLVKAVVGALLGVALMAALYYGFDVELGTRRLSSHYAIVAAVWGVLFGAYVEFDESTESTSDTMEEF